MMPALLLTLALLSACDKGPMPSLYHFHSDEFRAPPGKSAPDIGYTYSPEYNAEAVSAWHTMIVDMVNRMETQTSLTPQAVYLVPHANKSSFMNMYEHSLRKTLNDRGYSLLSAPDQQATYLFYEAAPVDKGEVVTPIAHKNEHARPMAFRIVALRGGTTIGITESEYILPLHGFEGGETTMYPADIMTKITPESNVLPVTEKPQPNEIFQNK